MRLELLSPRTKKYIEALIREGDSFNHFVWLKRVRQEEAAIKGNWSVVSNDTLSNKSKSPKSGDTQIITTKLESQPATSVVRSAIKSRLPVRPLSRNRGLSSLSQRIAGVEDAWRAMQRKSRRDAIYSYLTSVFDLVMACQGRRRTKKLLRCTSALIGDPAGKNADPLAAVIRCTCDAGVDRKTISRWSRALRYVAHRKGPDTPLKKFMIDAGGVNACADRYARYYGRS